MGVLVMPPAVLTGHVGGALGLKDGHLIHSLALGAHGGHHLFINRIPPRLPKEDVEATILSQLRTTFVLSVLKCSVIPQNSLKNKGYGFITLDGQPTPQDLDDIANSLNNQLTIGNRSLGVRVCTDAHKELLLGEEEVGQQSSSPDCSPPSERGSCESPNPLAPLRHQPAADKADQQSSLKETPCGALVLQSAAEELAQQTGNVVRRRKGAKLDASEAARSLKQHLPAQDGRGKGGREERSRRACSSYGSIEAAQQVVAAQREVRSEATAAVGRITNPALPSHSQHPHPARSSVSASGMPAPEKPPAAPMSGARPGNGLQSTHPQLSRASSGRGGSASVGVGPLGPAHVGIAHQPLPQQQPVQSHHHHGHGPGRSLPMKQPSDLNGQGRSGRGLQQPCGHAAHHHPDPHVGQQHPHSPHHSAAVSRQQQHLRVSNGSSGSLGSGSSGGSSRPGACSPHTEQPQGPACAFAGRLKGPPSQVAPRHAAAPRSGSGRSTGPKPALGCRDSSVTVSSGGAAPLFRRTGSDNSTSTTSSAGTVGPALGGAGPGAHSAGHSGPQASGAHPQQAAVPLLRADPRQRPSLQGPPTAQVPRSHAYPAAPSSHQHGHAPQLSQQQHPHCQQPSRPPPQQLSQYRHQQPRPQPHARAQVHGRAQVEAQARRLQQQPKQRPHREAQTLQAPSALDPTVAQRLQTFLMAAEPASAAAHAAAAAQMPIASVAAAPSAFGRTGGWCVQPDPDLALAAASAAHPSLQTRSMPVTLGHTNLAQDGSAGSGPVLGGLSLPSLAAAVGSRFGAGPASEPDSCSDPLDPLNPLDWEPMVLQLLGNDDEEDDYVAVGRGGGGDGLSWSGGPFLATPGLDFSGCTSLDFCEGARACSNRGLWNGRAKSVGSAEARAGHGVASMAARPAVGTSAGVSYMMTPGMVAAVTAPWRQAAPAVAGPSPCSGAAAAALCLASVLPGPHAGSLEALSSLRLAAAAPMPGSLPSSSHLEAVMQRMGM